MGVRVKLLQVGAVVNRANIVHFFPNNLLRELMAHSRVHMSPEFSRLFMAIWKPLSEHLVALPETEWCLLEAVPKVAQ